MQRLLLIGFGNVAQELVRILDDHTLFPHFNPQQFVVTGIATRTRGNVYNPEGLILKRLLPLFNEQNRFAESLPEYFPGSAQALVGEAEYDVLIELSTLNLSEKSQSAIGYIRTALERKKHVVTANKGPLVFAYQQLKSLAEQNRRAFLFESTVMDGTPVFNLKRYALRSVEITGFQGVLNSTTNFLLAQMEKGLNVEEALAKARALKIVEADPRNDLDGWDAAVKTAALCNVFFNQSIDLQSIERDTFDLVNPQTVIEDARQNKRWKFICSASRENGTVKARVRLQRLDQKHPFFAVSGTSSVLRIEARGLAPLTIVQENPTITDTAFGVINDLLQILENWK